jgi:hypothetical protein
MRQIFSRKVTAVIFAGLLAIFFPNAEYGPFQTLLVWIRGATVIAKCSSKYPRFNEIAFICRPSSFVISHCAEFNAIFREQSMARSTQHEKVNRAPRVKLGGSVLFLARLENGRQLRGKLHQLSTTGGLLQLEKPLDEGIKVEVIFHVGNSTVRSKAKMLFPMWATQGYLQPFEFDELSESERSCLQANLQKLLKGSPAIALPSVEVVNAADPTPAS